MKKSDVFNALVFPFIRLYWFIFRPKTYGVKCVIECGGEVLMIRNTYGRKRWTFPGGSIDEGEMPEAAAKREVMEEVGIQLHTVRRLGEFISELEYKKDHITVFAGNVEDKDFRIDPKEILEARWFSMNGLPEMSEIARKVIEMMKDSSQ